jgi:hypothetical protein
MGLFRRNGVAAVTSDTPFPVDTTTFPDSIDGRADALLAALRQGFAQPQHLGAPFGPHRGVEIATSWIRQVTPDPLEFRPVGERAADALVKAIRAKIIDLETVDRALGITEEAFRQYGLSKRDGLSTLSSYQERTSLLVAMARQDFNALVRWFKDDEFALASSAYFLVALLRLQTAGRQVTY